MKISQDTTNELTVVAETNKEVRDVFMHFRIPEDTQSFIDALTKGSYVHVSRPKERFWFPVSATVFPEFIAPYLEKLKEITGFDADLGTINPAPWNDYGFALVHTHIVSHAEINEYGYVCNGFIQSQDWNGKTARHLADINFEEYVRKFLGVTYREPEFILSGGWGGQMKLNPNYLKTHYAKPGIESLAIWQCIFETWCERFATPGQRAVIDDARSCYSQISKGNRAFTDSLLRGYSAFVVKNWTEKTTFEEFKGLK